MEWPLFGVVHDDAGVRDKKTSQVVSVNGNYTGAVVQPKKKEQRYFTHREHFGCHPPQRFHTLNFPLPDRIYLLTSMRSIPLTAACMLKRPFW